MNTFIRGRVKVLATVLVTLAACLPLLAAAQLDRGQAREGWKMIEEGALVIDVRSESEYLDGHLDEAIHIPYQNTDDLVYYIGENKDRPVVMYCGSGRRVGLAIDALERLGYTKLHNATGIEALLATEPER